MSFDVYHRLLVFFHTKSGSDPSLVDHRTFNEYTYIMKVKCQNHDKENIWYSPI